MEDLCISVSMATSDGARHSLVSCEKDAVRGAQLKTCAMPKTPQSAPDPDCNYDTRRDAVVVIQDLACDLPVAVFSSLRAAIEALSHMSDRSTWHTNRGRIIAKPLATWHYASDELCMYILPVDGGYKPQHDIWCCFGEARAKQGMPLIALFGRVEAETSGLEHGLDEPHPATCNHTHQVGIIGSVDEFMCSHPLWMVMNPVKNPTARASRLIATASGVMLKTTAELHTKVVIQTSDRKDKKWARLAYEVVTATRDEPTTHIFDDVIELCESDITHNRIRSITVVYNVCLGDTAETPLAWKKKGDKYVPTPDDVYGADVPVQVHTNREIPVYFSSATETPTLDGSAVEIFTPWGEWSSLTLADKADPSTALAMLVRARITPAKAMKVVTRTPTRIQERDFAGPTAVPDAKRTKAADTNDAVAGAE